MGAPFFSETRQRGGVASVERRSEGIGTHTIQHDDKHGSGHKGFYHQEEGAAVRTSRHMRALDHGGAVAHGISGTTPPTVLFDMSLRICRIGRHVALTTAACGMVAAAACNTLDLVQSSIGESSTDVVFVLLKPVGTFNPETRVEDPWPELLATDTLVVEAWRCLNRNDRSNRRRFDACTRTSVTWGSLGAGPGSQSPVGERIVIRASDIDASPGPAGIQSRVVTARHSEGGASGGPLFVFPWTSLALATDSLAVRIGERVRLPYEGRGPGGVIETSGRLLPSLGTRSATGRTRVEQSGAWTSRGIVPLVMDQAWVRGVAVGRDTLTVQAAGRTLRLVVQVTP